MNTRDAKARKAEYKSELQAGAEKARLKTTAAASKAKEQARGANLSLYRIFIYSSPFAFRRSWAEKNAPNGAYASAMPMAHFMAMIYKSVSLSKKFLWTGGNSPPLFRIAIIGSEAVRDREKNRLIHRFKQAGWGIRRAPVILDDIIF
jgi:hypothetical protein